VTRTVAGPATTVTATVAPVYLGLYGFSPSGDALFRVNDRPGFTVRPGAVFAKNFRYVSVTGADPACAVVSYGDERHTVCEGQVERVG
jgi:hypothetical protein